ncbi:MAG: hypothetical protein PHV30_03885 [Candidatus Margulisbacteria bacterium]|nr:hypothetical protein [Candidatus Margulisiibacteriota bacterium]
MLAAVYQVDYYGNLSPQLLRAVPFDLKLDQDETGALKYWSRQADNFILYNNDETDNWQQVSFRRVPAPAKSPVKLLLYSNKPESISQSGVLYKRDNVSGNFRLLFYHMNAGDDDGVLYVSIKPGQNRPFYYTAGIGGPDPSGIYVGRVIARTLFKEPNCGYLMNQNLERSYEIKKSYVFGGIIDVFPLNESVTYDVSVTFCFNNDMKDEAEKKYNRQSGDLYRYHEIVTGVPLTNGNKLYNIVIGQDKFLQHNTKTLDGNYGVNHRYEIFFPSAGIYGMYLTPNGGPAGLVFKLDEKVYEYYASQDIFLMDIIVDFPQTKVLETFPLPGSNYPVTITLKKKK